MPQHRHRAEFLANIPSGSVKPFPLILHAGSPRVGVVKVLVNDYSPWVRNTRHLFQSSPELEVKPLLLSPLNPPSQQQELCAGVIPGTQELCPELIRGTPEPCPGSDNRCCVSRSDPWHNQSSILGHTCDTFEGCGTRLGTLTGHRGVTVLGGDSCTTPG